jgi:hypothetical protein
MKTLLERLKDEYVIALNNNREKYPHSTDAIFDELKNNTHWIDLKYGTVCYIINQLRLTDYSDYSPAGISKLFNH